jgi:hypothetical protein
MLSKNGCVQGAVMTKEIKSGQKQYRTGDQLSQDDEVIMELYLEGCSVLKILSQFKERSGRDYTPSYDDIAQALTRILKYWADQTVKKYDAYVNKELAKLDKLEMEYWEAWEESKKELTGVEQRKTPAGKVVNKAWKRSSGGGNPKFLDGVGKCIAQRLAIMRPIFAHMEAGSQQGLTMQELLLLAGQAVKALQAPQIIDVEAEEM